MSHAPLLVTLLSVLATGIGLAAASGPQYQHNPQVIKLDLPPAPDSAGSLVTADLDGDGRLDYLVTVPGHLGAYAHDGRKLWVLQVPLVVGGSSESEGLPGHHGAGVQAGDLDGDGRAEVVFLTKDGLLHVVSGASGQEEWQARPPVPAGAERWEHAAIANFRGQGDRDLLLQATNAQGYRVGHYLAAYAASDLRQAKPPLWQRDDFGALAHGPARLADLNGDGRDEVLGFTIVRPDGTLPGWAYPPRSKELAGGASFHIDYLGVANVRPDLPGLEVVLLEEGRNYVALVNLERGVLWHRPGPGREEPQNAAVGNFDPRRPGLEIWCRSRHNTNQTPWVMDARGEVIAEWKMAERAPAGWTDAGVETIWAIDWTGGERQLAAAKERHRSGDVAVFDPITGEFVARFPERADRIYVADVSGDWREEILVLAGSELHIYHNPRPNPRPGQPRLWTQQHYRRSKMNWNYYSP